VTEPQNASDIEQYN